MGLPADTTITWYGHSVIELTTPGGKTVLIDPWFGNPSSPRAADSVDHCDLLLVTHGHDDHMGNAVALASRLRPIWPCVHEMSLWLARQLPGGGDAAIGMNKGGTVEAAGLKVTMTHADHSAGDWNAGGETTLYLGEPAGFVIELENGYRIYHAGDTEVFGDMAIIRELHRPDLAMLPIGGHFTMGPRGAAMAVELLGVEDVVPLHYGTFPKLAGTPDALARGARRARARPRHGPCPGAGRVDPRLSRGRGASARARGRAPARDEPRDRLRGRCRCRLLELARGRRPALAVALRLARLAVRVRCRAMTFQPGCRSPTAFGPPAHGGLPVHVLTAAPSTVSTSISVVPSSISPATVTRLPTCGARGCLHRPTTTTGRRRARTPCRSAMSV